MSANDEIIKFSRNIVMNSLANGKIDPVDLNLLYTSAAPFLSEAENDVVALLAYCHSKDGVTSVSNVYASSNNEPRLIVTSPL